MTTRPWMPLYIADYLADTAHLNAAQSGAYLHLIMHYWQTGKLPDDDDALARIARMKTGEWSKARPIIAPFFSDGWKHKRIESELEQTARVAASYAQRAKHAATQRWSKDASSTAPGMPEQCLDMPSLPSQSKKDGASAPPIDPDADLFRRGKQVLGPDAGSLIARLKKSKGGSIPHTRAAIEQASTKNNPREYIGRILNGAAEQSDNSFRDNPTAGSFL